MADRANRATLELRRDFDDRHTFLWAVLGVLSLLEQLAGVLERHGRGSAPDAGSIAGRGAEAPPALLAVLGLVSVAGAVRTHVERVAGSDGHPAKPDAPGRPRAPDRLRDLLV